MPLGKKEPAEQIAPLCCSTPLPPQTCSRGKTVVFLLNRACALRSRFPNCVSIVSLEHLLRYCARPPFALERLSVNRGADGRIARVRYVLPQHFGGHTGDRSLGLIEAARPRRLRRRNWHVHDGIIGRLFSRRPPHLAELFSVKNGR